MSVDNGIYIAKFKDGYRVIHGMAIDNLYWFPAGSDEEKEEWKRYFNGSKLLATEQEANEEADRMCLEYSDAGESPLGEVFPINCSEGPDDVIGPNGKVLKAYILTYSNGD